MSETPNVTFKPELAPVSRATNAYELLDDVIDAIMEEPARLFMDTWFLTVKDISEYLSTNLLERAPACGTAACAAGWIVWLGRPDLHKRMALDMGMINIPDQACNLILGAPEGRFDEGITPDMSLFERQALTCRNLMRNDLNKLFTTYPDQGEGESGNGPRVGTPEYARVIADAITSFQNKYYYVLKATPVTTTVQAAPSEPQSEPQSSLHEDDAPDADMDYDMDYDTDDEIVSDDDYDDYDDGDED